MLVHKSEASAQQTMLLTIFVGLCPLNIAELSKVDFECLGIAEMAKSDRP